MNLIEKYGWNNIWEEKMPSSGIAGRVLLEHKNLYRVITNEGEWLCSLSGKFKFGNEREAFPAVGDWVVLEKMPGEEKGIIQEVLPRSSQFSRKVAGMTTEIQIIAVNVDYVFLVMSLNHDFNLRRLERYLLAAWDSGATPVVVLTKKDACADLAYYISEVESVAFGVDVFTVSSFTGEGIDSLAGLLLMGKTGALLGSSGVGKSSLINALSGTEVMVVNDIRDDDSKGRHTTTHRELSLLPCGGLLIDTPGMREFQLWDNNEGVSASFQDIEGLAENCRFRDCKHEKEPGCAIRDAIFTGTLKDDRYKSYVKLMRELAHIERKNDAVARKAEVGKWKQLSKTQRSNSKRK